MHPLTQALIQKLDLEEFLHRFSAYLSRESNIFLGGDSHDHFRYIKALDGYVFNAPASIPMVEEEIKLLKKQGHITISSIVAFFKVIRYLKYLKSLPFEGLLKRLTDDINIPPDIEEINLFFDDKFELLDSVSPELYSVNKALKTIDEQITRAFEKVLNNPNSAPYLVDKKIHLVEGSEAILLRGGFNKVVPSKVVSRSSSGFFYVLPYSVAEIKFKRSRLIDEKEAIIYNIAKSISTTLTKHLSFLSFSQRFFNRFDAYQARVKYAKDYDLQLLCTSNTKQIVLDKFAHPAIQDPVPISIDFSKVVLIVTGVNSGGKTMLLKALLSAVFLAKHILPMQINPTKSKIGAFKELIPIIEDPQNVMQNISTFAGRMLTFSKLFHKKKSLLVGVDEIELGTDSDEAASLFKVILEELIQKDNKIIVTTHHKKLAALMAKHPQIELLAALYDQERQQPTYTFLKGTIGKSFAFETAKRFHIPDFVVKRAKETYGKDQEELGALIEKSTELEIELKTKTTKVDEELQKIEHIKNDLKRKQDALQQEYKKQKQTLEMQLFEAIEMAQKAIKEHPSNAHKLINKAHKTYEKKQPKTNQLHKPEKFKVGDTIKYHSTKGKILSLQGKYAFIQTDTLRLKVPLADLKPSGFVAPKKQITLHIDKPKKANLTLDLHGLRSDEAIDQLSAFISNAAMNDLAQVHIYHGIGSGRLAFVVREFLKVHPCILEYQDAPSNMGGFGATIATLSLNKL